jgi:hypothetical protein
MGMHVNHHLARRFQNSHHTQVLQPGFMITHWHHLKHAALSLLGLITLTAAVVSTFYTTASDTLVSPKLKYGRPEDRTMVGVVKSSYANPIYIASQCQTPITLAEDVNAGDTCLAVEHSGQSFHNALAYLTTWQNFTSGGATAPLNLADRPLPVGILYDNTTVTGSWVETEHSNITVGLAEHNRVINNITMAMPHAGVLAASHDPVNGILQPEDLAGVGEYNVRAAVVSPTVNILCVNMNKTELEPLIYVDWPNADFNISTDGTGQRLAG